VELVKLQEKAPVFQTMGVKVLAISVDTPENAKRMQEKTGATSFTFLSDPEGRMLDLLGIRHKGGGNEGQDVAQSTTLILDRQGKIRWISVAETFAVRPSPDLVVREATRVAGPAGTPPPAPAPPPAKPAGS
jgi:peroxiredoxin